MPVRRGGARRRKYAELTEAEHFELACGPYGTSVFDNEVERKEAWRLNAATIRHDWPHGPTFAERRYVEGQN